MPSRPHRQCTYPGCGELTLTKDARCASHPRHVFKSNNEATRIRGPELQRLRASLFSQTPLCVFCKDLGRVTVATERDHIVPLAQGGTDTRDNTQALCAPCHAQKSEREKQYGKPFDADEQRRMPADLKPSCVPLTIVCGPPGAGKSTYVAAHAKAEDLVIDLDVIQQEISGIPKRPNSNVWLNAALIRRNDLLRHLERTKKYARAWFIISAPDPVERKRWQAMLGGVITLLPVSVDVCINRINADESRDSISKATANEAARRWWKHNNELKLQ